MIGLLIIELFLMVATAIQVWYVVGLAKGGTEVNTATKTVVGVNVTLLVGLMLLFAYLLVRMQAGR